MAPYHPIIPLDAIQLKDIPLQIKQMRALRALMLTLGYRKLDRDLTLRSDGQVVGKAIRTSERFASLILVVLQPKRKELFK
jgi:hypothetical protein